MMKRSIFSNHAARGKAQSFIAPMLASPQRVALNNNNSKSWQRFSTKPDVVNVEKTAMARVGSALPDDGLTLQDFVQGNHNNNNQQTTKAASSTNSTGPMFHIKTYGCQMNVNDTDIVRSILLNNGFQETFEEQRADIWLTNTCAIREKAESKVWQRLQKQKKDKGKIVGLLGCMAERLKADILEKQLANVVVGPDAYRELPKLLSQELVSNQGESDANNYGEELDVLSGLHLKSYKDETYEDIMPQMALPQETESLATPATHAFVSIQRGCSNRCSFCIVPFTRGPERSRPLETIIREVETLLEQNSSHHQKIREIVLLGQNVNSYHDQSQAALEARPTAVVNGLSNDGFRNRINRPTQGGYSFGDLLERVAAIDPELRVRFTSPHPKDYPQDLLHLMAETPNICNQLHMPAQSGSTTMLKRMKRGYTRDAYLELIDNAKTIIPNVAISSDFIAGFCGETHEEHLDTLSLLEYVEYEQAFLFAYSMREQTFAARKWQDNVPSDIKQQRLQELIDTFRSRIHDKNHRTEVGQLRLVLLEGPAKKNKLVFGDDDDNVAVEAWQGRTDQNKRIFFPYTPVLDKDIVTSLAASITAPTGVASSPPPSETTAMAQAGEYAVVQVTEAKGHTLRGRMLGKTTLASFAKFEANTLAHVDEDHLQHLQKEVVLS